MTYFWIDRGTCRFCGGHALALVNNEAQEWDMLEGWGCDHASQSGADWCMVRPGSRLWEEAMRIIPERDTPMCRDAARFFGLVDEPCALDDVRAEMSSQIDLWGEQNHPDGTGLWHRGRVSEARETYEAAKAGGYLAWRHILDEEVAEAFAESDPARLREELVQVAAVAASWIEAIDRRGRRDGFD